MYIKENKYERMHVKWNSIVKLCTDLKYTMK